MAGFSAFGLRTLQVVHILFSVGSDDPGLALGALVYDGGGLRPDPHPPAPLRIHCRVHVAVLIIIILDF